MYALTKLDHTLINERVSEFRDQVKRPAVRANSPRTNSRSAPAERRLFAAARLHVPRRDPLWHAVVEAAAPVRPCRRAATIAAMATSPHGRTSQFNWIKLSELPDALADLADVGNPCDADSGNQHAQTSPRTSGPASPRRDRGSADLVGIDPPDTTLHRNFVPAAQFKIAIRLSSTTVPDQDPRHRLRLLKNADGETGFEVLVGGGLGRTPFHPKTIKPFVSGATS